MNREIIITVPDGENAEAIAEAIRSITPLEVRVEEIYQCPYCHGRLVESFDETQDEDTMLRCPDCHYAEDLEDGEDDDEED